MTDLQAFFARRGSLADAALQGVGVSRPPNISRKGNRFTLIDGAGNTKPVETFHVDVVVVGVNRHPSKMYFAGAYSPDNTGPPTCWGDNGTGPSVYAAEPQSKTCMLCPHNEWGTGKRGTGRACQDSKKLAVVVVGDDSGLIYEFKVPPGSFKSKNNKLMGWEQYVTSISGFMLGNRKADLFDIVTRITFVPDTDVGILSFAPLGLVSDTPGLMEQLSALLNDEAIDLVTGVKDVARDPNAPLEVQQKPIAPPVQPVNAPPSITQQAIEKRHRATKAEMEQRRAAQAPTRPVQTSASTDMGEVPAFLQRAPATPTAPQNGGAQFGIQANPLPPPAKLTDALNKAFNLKTG